MLFRSQCEVLHPVIGKKIQALRELFSKFDMKQSIPQLEIAITEQKNTAIVRHLTPLTEKDKNLLIEFAKENNLQILLQPKGIKTINSLYPSDEPTVMHYELEPYNLKMCFQPWQFTQVNAEINNKMIQQAIKLLDLHSTDTVLDLFCGIGNFSLAIAKFAKKVIGIEGEKTAVAMATHNAEQNSIFNSEFYSFDLYQDPSAEKWANTTYDKILLDPARSGAKEILPWIAKWQPRRIVYVSCNPSTLARDCKTLVDLGYTMQAAGMMDMFPQTEHTEAMVLFTLDELADERQHGTI